MTNIGVYRITDLTNGKSYVGQSTDIQKRWSDHRSYSTSKTLREAIKQHGIENFLFEIVEACSNEALDEREIWWIARLSTTTPEFGYNKLSGGSYGMHSEDSKLLMSALKKERYRGIGNPFHGKRHCAESRNKISKNNSSSTPEGKAKISAAMKGKPWSPARRAAHIARKGVQ